jgi:hypothetical protein
MGKRRRSPRETKREFECCRAALDEAYAAGDHHEVIRILTRMVLLEQELLQCAVFDRSGHAEASASP